MSKIVAYISMISPRISGRPFVMMSLGFGTTIDSFLVGKPVIL